MKATCERYLRSAKPLLDEAEYDRMVRLADEFQRNEGRTFQLFLKLKSWCVCVDAQGGGEGEKEMRGGERERKR